MVLLEVGEAVRRRSLRQMPRRVLPRDRRTPVCLERTTVVVGVEDGVGFIPTRAVAARSHSLTSAVGDGLLCFPALRPLGFKKRGVSISVHSRGERDSSLLQLRMLLSLSGCNGVSRNDGARSEASRFTALGFSWRSGMPIRCSSHTIVAWLATLATNAANAMLMCSTTGISFQSVSNSCYDPAIAMLGESTLSSPSTLSTIFPLACPCSSISNAFAPSSSGNTACTTG